MRERPTIGITVGDPAGAGRDLATQLVADPAIQKVCTLRVFGADEARGMSANRRDGPDELSRQIARQALLAAARAALDGSVHGVVTGPAFPTTFRTSNERKLGATEILANLTGCAATGSLFYTNDLRTIPITGHIPLADVPRQLSVHRIVTAARVAHSWLRRYLGREPRLALAGLNPHAGEGGLFGSEETEILLPAIEECGREAIEIAGPHPPEDVFLEREYDAVLCCYHDLALIPVRMLHPTEYAIVTMGLPFLRVSIDHRCVSSPSAEDFQRFRFAVRVAATLAMQLGLPTTED